MAQGTVLLVDDDPTYRALLRATLERADFEVAELEDGARTVEVALRVRPDVVLLDWRMPGVSGITACRLLRAEPELAGVRIAMVTGLDDARDRALARKAGADAFVVKDAGAGALSHVRRLMAGKSSRAEAG